VKNPSPRFPVDELSYEAYDPEKKAPISDVFVGGWSRKASDGLVGLARKDGTNAAKAVIEYLQTLPTMTPDLPAIAHRMHGLPGPIITQDEIEKLSAVEKAEAEKRGLPEFKFGTNEEMLQAIGLAAATA
jgi:ferredoxin--NADP+ reductase